MNRDAIIQTLQTRLPHLLGIYAFGSRITGTAGQAVTLTWPCWWRAMPIR
jgi:hypothetical protein